MRRFYLRMLKEGIREDATVEKSILKRRRVILRRNRMRMLEEKGNSEDARGRKSKNAK